MAEPRLDLVLLWHMHQPDFRDQRSGEFREPWVYLHVLKDYSDMAAHLEAHPGVRAVLNFTPVLLDQLEDYADQFATGQLRDPLLRLLAKPDPFELDEDERARVLASCFRCNHEKMVAPYPAYARLLSFHALARKHGDVAADYLSPQYLADLVTWYHLAWVGETVRRNDTCAARLLLKAQHFSAEDRQELLALYGREITNVIPRYRALAQRGQIELCTTPSRHPIGPLLIDFDVAREAMPDAPLPESPAYPGGRERAHAHLEAALDSHARRFGAKPRGIWPAEGAVSEAFLELLEAEGCEWFASGEGVLTNTLARSDPPPTDRNTFLYRPWRAAGRRLQGFFRDDRLSDRIGFEYAKWHSDEAAANFIAELEAIAAAAPEGKRPIVSVILDGENAWEYYPYNGYYFLDSLYAALDDHPELATTTFSAVIDRNHEIGTLPPLVAGSWVHGNLGTWIGSPDKNHAWDLLCAAKAACDKVLASGRLTDAQRDAVFAQLADCEASDWCWWFGDYNPPDAVAIFDALYRDKLAHLYRLIGLDPPATLETPVSLGGSREGGTEGAMRRAS